jgi:hypothetical protein
MERKFIVTIKDNNIECNETEKQDQENVKEKTFNRILFLIMTVPYLILLLFALIEPESLEANSELLGITIYSGLCMALYSFWIAFCYSNYFAPKLLKIFKKVKKHNEKFYLFLCIVILLLFSFFIMVYIEYKYDIPYISKGNIQNILTWLSVLIFTIDKLFE